MIESYNMMLPIKYIGEYGDDDGDDAVGTEA